MTIKSINKIISQRAEIYFLMAQLFIEPNSEFSNIINHMEQVITSEYSSSLKSYQEMKKIILNFHDEDYGEMITAYSALFIGPFETIAPPFASVYLDEGILMGGSTMTVIECYRAIGMEVQSGRSIENLPDHISVELEYLFHCLMGYYESGDESFYQLAHAFVDSHLMKWVPEFVQGIKKSDIHSFYNNLAVFLMQFLEEDQEKFFQQ